MSKNVGGLPSWLVQLDSPGTALTLDEWIRPGGAKQLGREGGYFDTTPAVITRGFDWQAPCLYFAQTSSIRPLLTMIMMIITELCGRRRLSSRLLVGEGQSLGTKSIHDAH